MTKYKTSGRAWEAKIEPVEVERETAESVWIDGRRCAKNSDWKCFFDSFEEAKKFALSLAQDRVNKSRRELENANSHFGNVKGLKPL